MLYNYTCDDINTHLPERCQYVSPVHVVHGLLQSLTPLLPQTVTWTKQIIYYKQNTLNGFVINTWIYISWPFRLIEVLRGE